MYNWIVNTIGVVPQGYEWIYGVGTIILYLAFIILLFSPLFVVFNMLKIKKRNRYY